MSSGIKTTIDRAGRVVIPKEAREEAGLAAGTLLEIVVRDGRIEIEPAPVEVRVERRGRVLVAVPVGEQPSLTAGVVDATRRELRRRGSDG